MDIEKAEATKDPEAEARSPILETEEQVPEPFAIPNITIAGSQPRTASTSKEDMPQKNMDTK